MLASMNQSYFIIAVVFMIYFTWVFYRGRNGFVQPNRLFLKAKQTAPFLEAKEMNQYGTSPRPKSTSGKYESANGKYDSAFIEKNTKAKDLPHGRERILSIHFNFNGHSFEAHEVLGVSQGSCLVVVEKAFQSALEKSHSDSREFLEMAMRAVRKLHTDNKNSNVNT